MKERISKVVVVSALFMFFIGTEIYAQVKNQSEFNLKKDLLLVNFDCKTDVDDLHTMASFATILETPQFSKLNYHAVAGTYGIQKGLYVPPNTLMQLAFRKDWTDAHENMDSAIEKVKKIVLKTIKKNGSIWIAEAGQSDFSSKLIQAIQKEIPKLVIPERFHIVQHSKWNEDKTAAKFLEFVKKNTDYHKIPDGNELGNGTPGFKSLDYKQWDYKIKNPKLVSVWKLATQLATQYNGKDGRYNNNAVAAGGLDFSDLSEICWILGLQDIKDVDDFFNRFGS